MKTTCGVMLSETFLKFAVLNQLKRMQNIEIAFEDTKLIDSTTFRDSLYNIILITDEVVLLRREFLSILKGSTGQEFNTILITNSIEPLTIKDYFELGIKGFVGRSNINTQLIEAISAVTNEKLYTKGLL